MTEDQETKLLGLSSIRQLHYVLNNLGLEVDYEIESMLLGLHPDIPRYGNEFTLASGKIVRAMSYKDPLSRLRALFELPIKLEDDIYESVASDRSDLPLEEIDILVRLQMNELLNNIEAIFPKMTFLKDIEEANWAKEGVSHLVKILREGIIGGVNSDTPNFYRSNPITWTVCKDSEYLLAERLNPSIGRASSAIFYDDEGNPILFQKTGGYKTNQDIDGTTKTSNATAINLVPVQVNGTEFPAGTLMGIFAKNTFKDYAIKHGDQAFHIDQIIGVQPLRLTFFALDDIEEREEAFGDHYNGFRQDARLSEPIIMDDFRNKAEKILAQDK